LQNDVRCPWTYWTGHIVGKKVGTGLQYDAAVHSDDDMRQIWQNWLGRLATEDPRVTGCRFTGQPHGAGHESSVPNFLFHIFFSLFVSTPPSSYKQGTIVVMIHSITYGHPKVANLDAHLPGTK
jgi:hypothetical protein